MRLDAIHVGDLVLCDVRGDRFHAEVTEVAAGELHIDARRVNGGRATQRTVTARQVVGHYRARSARRRAARHDHHEQLEAAA